MAKAKDTVFFCTECGYESSKWSGQCPACKAWNTLVEAPAQQEVKALSGKPAVLGMGGPLAGDARPSFLKDITASDSGRIRTGIEEFDRVLGGGIIKGSLVLVGGDPGIGKSTLLTQVCKCLSDAETEVLYISGEESLQQIKLRADRLGEFSEHMKLLCETDLNVIGNVVASEKPAVCIIDSIQTMFRPEVSGAPGSQGQIRESTSLLLQLAKGLGITIFVVGHVTKDGTVAGPRMLEHMVDTVLYFEGENQGTYRILRSVKNRFGSTNEIGVFEMCQDGLKEVKNPSEFLLMGRPEGAPGSVVSCAMEGTRQVLVEVQALVAKSVFGNPRRSATGIDYGRLNMLIAVLEKRMGLHMSENDVYANVVGGLRVTETALDLAVIIAMASSCLDYPACGKLAAFGEVGLSGEVRNVSKVQARVREARKMGFTTCIVPKASLKTLEDVEGIRIIGVNNVKDAIVRSREVGKADA